MEPRKGGPPPSSASYHSITSYVFGSSKLAPQYYLELETEDPASVSFPELFQNPISTSSAPPKIIKNAWGPINKNINTQFRKKRTGYIEKLPIEIAIHNISITDRPALFHPRGLINRDTKCFLNTTIQTLVACPQFYGLIRRLRRTSFQDSDYPVLSRVIKLVEEFDPVEQNVRKSILEGVEVSIPIGQTFAPTYFYDLLKDFNPVFGDWQEDMQEFLLFVIDRLHTELLTIQEKSPIVQEQTRNDNFDSPDEWESVGKKNKAAIVVTDVSKFKSSAISKIFGGQIQSVISMKNAKSSAALEPFYCLHLDIAPNHISSLDDALNFHFSTEQLDDYKDGAIVNKSNSISILPPVLIIHLKRFAYINGRSQKVHKPIFYTEQLVIKTKWVSSAFTVGRTFNLHSVTRHLGAKAQGGHYTCNVKQGHGEWLHFDDSEVTSIDLEDVLDDPNAYVLVYVRDPKATL